MRRWKEESQKLYKEEYLKQTKPYQYELLCGHMGKNTATSASKPVSGTVISFPNEQTNILNFEGIGTEYLVFVHKDGLMDEGALERLLGNANGADIVYSDEDFTIDVNADISTPEGRMNNLRTPWRKPDYSHDTLLSFPYIETFFAIRTVFARSVPAIQKSQEVDDNVRLWDFLLRATERTNRIVHVPEILYHRAAINLFDKLVEPSSVSDEDIYKALYDKYNQLEYNQCRAAAQKRRGMAPLMLGNNEAEKEDERENPLVSIIIPSKDHPDMLKDCIRSIRVNAGKISYEVIVIDNGSSEDLRKKAENIVLNIPGDAGRYIYEEFDFDFAKMCNMGADVAKGSFLLFLNDDIDVICDNFLERLLMYAAMPHVGAVGAKLLYPEDNLIQHIGITDMNRGPTHKLMTFSDSNIHFYCRNKFAWDVLAVTAACLMVDREKFIQAGGFSDRLKIGYNDVDFCVKLYEKGYLNVVNNECVLLHKESVSRGIDSEDKAKSDRLSSERTFFYEAHPWLKNGYDPFYNPYLDRDTIEYKSYLVPDYQITDYRNIITEKPKLPVKASDKVYYSIDSCRLEYGIEEGNCDAYVFDGWGLINKKDNALMRRYLLLAPIDADGKLLGNCIIANVSPKYRRDVEEVFPDAKNAALAGFECRIDTSILEEGRQYKMGVLIKSMGMFDNYKLALGDIYEPGRGIITDK